MKTLEDLAELLKKVEYVKDTFAIKTYKILIYELNKVLQEQNEHEVIAERHISQLKQIIRNKAGFRPKRFRRIDRALDMYINLYGHKDVTSKDICHYLVENTHSLDNQLFNNFKQYQYYFMIRNSYSVENCITVSVIRFSYEYNVVKYQVIRASEKINRYFISEGAVFMNGRQSLAIVGMVTNKLQQPKTLEHISLNILHSPEDENIFNGVYFGCCLKNSAYTPFATRICFVPIDNDLIPNKEEQKSLTMFSFAFMNTDPYDDDKQLRQIVKKTHNNMNLQDKEFDIFQKSLTSAGLSLTEIVETRIKAKIDDRDNFNGLREFSLF